MKKRHVLAVGAVGLMATGLALGVLPGAAASAETADGEKPLTIMTTIFPEYDWVMNILGDNPGGAQVTMLLDNGVDLHSYQPTADDIMNISTCDLFIYVGGESDAWVQDALKEAVNSEMTVISLMDVLGDAVREEETVEGIQAHEEDGHEAHEEHDGHEEGEEETGETEYDEHVWLSLKNAGVCVSAIAGALEEKDASNAAVYEENAQAYLDALSALDQDYQAAVDEAGGGTLLFGDRFPFRYLTDDYGLSYYAAFDGCSAETEASFETIMFLAQKLDELSLHTCLTIEGSDQRVAQTIVQSTKSQDQQILSLNSMQSVTTKDAQEGTTYLSVMEENLETLKKALG